jgi:hypothetical protein
MSEVCTTCGGVIDSHPAVERPPCTWDGDHPICPDCRAPIIGCRWNMDRCLDCHEAALLPPPYVELPDDY